MKSWKAWKIAYISKMLIDIRSFEGIIEPINFAMFDIQEAKASDWLIFTSF